jgi:DNA (cytosine-5)-methyltransferase 1
VSTITAVDLFAGPGGWDVAYRNIGKGRTVLGIELDAAACQTRRANGLWTRCADVSKQDPCHRDFVGSIPYTEGLIASPPCQTFSLAGKGAGRKDLDKIIEAMEWMKVINVIPKFDDERTGLVLEPLYWAIERINVGKPFKWIALEQVPGVLPVWESMAGVLRDAGYSVVTSVLSAEQYGVPQTRKRAVLLAHLTRDVKLPAATHRKYKKGTPQELGDPDLKPWVSMADALGWEGLVGFPRKDDGREVVEIDGTAYRARDLRSVNEPAQVVTEKARSWMRRNSGPGAARDPRPVTAPAYTIRANGSGSHPSGTEWTTDAGERIQ